MPVRRTRRRALLTAALLAGLAAGLTPASAGSSTAAATQAASSAELRTRVDALRGQIDAAGRELAAGAVAWEDAERRLGVMTQEQFALAEQLDGQAAATSAAQSGLDAVAREAYKGGRLAPALAAVMSGDPRSLSDLSRLRLSVMRLDAARRDELGELVLARSRGRDLLARQAALRRQALTDRQALEARQERLATRSRELSAELSARAVDLRRALAREAAARAAAARAAAQAAAQAAAETAAAARRSAAAPPAASAVVLPAATAPAPDGTCLPPTAHDYPNGFLPDAVLCQLEQGPPGARLRTDAARAFDALSRARTAATGKPLCVTDTYRDYAGQVDVFARKPHLAAVPGRSQHGWGVAVDLCGGVQRFGTEAYLWMKANAPRYGWVHPAWAEPGGKRPEPWHWEYVGR